MEYSVVKKKEIELLLNDEKIRLANNVRYIRRNKKITQQLLAHYCKTSIRAISQIETCSGCPELYTVAKIASFAGVEFKEMFGELKR